MTITTTLTARDKKLLIFLAVFLVFVAVGWFVIRPALLDISELNKELANAELLQRQNIHSLSRITQEEEEQQQSKQALTEITADVYPLMQSQEIDRLLTMEALHFGFQKSELRELTIYVPEEYTVLLPYLQKADEDEDEALLTGIYAAEVSFTLQGNREKLEGFCDRLVNDYPAIRVSEFYWQEDKTDTTVYNLTILCRIYMSDMDSITAEAPESVQTP